MMREEVWKKNLKTDQFEQKKKEINDQYAKCFFEHFYNLSPACGSAETFAITPP